MIERHQQLHIERRSILIALSQGMRVAVQRDSFLKLNRIACELMAEMFMSPSRRLGGSIPVDELNASAGHSQANLQGSKTLSLTDFAVGCVARVGPGGLRNSGSAFCRRLVDCLSGAPGGHLRVTRGAPSPRELGALTGTEIA